MGQWKRFIFDEEFKENFGHVVGREIPDLIEKSVSYLLDV